MSDGVPNKGYDVNEKNGHDIIGNSTNGKPAIIEVPLAEITGPADVVLQNAGNPPKVLRGDSTYSMNYPEADQSDDSEEVSLLYARHERIPLKDFSSEVRGSLDVENFLKQAGILLDVSETSLDTIIDQLLHEALHKTEPQCPLEEAKKAFFTHDQVHQLAKTIQGTCATDSGGFDYDQSWICCFCTLPNVQRRHVAIARLRQPANFGRTSQEVQFIIMVIAPTKEKGTKNALETGRTFATIFADIELRQQLLAAATPEEFKQTIKQCTVVLAEEQNQGGHNQASASTDLGPFDDTGSSFKYPIFRGLIGDFKRRIKYYVSDYKDGFVGRNTIHKTLATTFFLYFACLLPSIAFGVLNDKNTHGFIDVKKVIIAQTFGGLFFATCGGQPLIILLTTAPLALYIKVIYSISEDFNLSFPAMYCCVGFWNSLFLLLYSVFDVSKLMKWSTRSTEEIFALFISIAFSVDAIKDIVHNFDINYNGPGCHGTTVTPAVNMTQVMATTAAPVNNTENGTFVLTTMATALQPCLRENSLLYLLLVLGTLWIGMSLYGFTKTPFLNAHKREILADYAVPVAVLLMSFFGSFVFKDVNLKQFNYYDRPVFSPAPLSQMTWGGVFGAMGLGFALSLLFFMDQNITAAMVMTPSNKLKKGPAYHWDLLIVSLMNALLSFFGLPWVHGALPHSPLHARALADVEDRVDQGHVHQRVVFVRETRVTAIAAHILIGLSLLMLPYPLSYIPKAVLNGLFLIVAFSALGHNQMFERLLLLVTEQAAYPPNHYIRTVPQRKVHLFTLTQVIQLAILCGFGFAPMPYLKMVFPVLLMFLLPIRHKVVPKVIDHKYLNALDSTN